MSAKLPVGVYHWEVADVRPPLRVWSAGECAYCDPVAVCPHDVRWRAVGTCRDCAGALVRPAWLLFCVHCGAEPRPPLAARFTAVFAGAVIAAAALWPLLLPLGAR